MIPLVDLLPHQCRWPANDAKPHELHLFCGAERIAGKSYCKAHQTIAYPGVASNNQPLRGTGGGVNAYDKTEIGFLKNANFKP